MSRVGRISLLLAAGLAVGVERAAGQMPEPPRFSVGVGAGMSNPLHGDFDFIAPSWDVAVRGRASEHLTIEAFVSQWRHSESSDRTNVTLQGPSGLIGTAGRLSQSSTREDWSTGVNVLPTFSRGRVTVTAGGGGGFTLLASKFRQSLTNCVTSTPTPCRDSSTSHAASSLTVQGVAGVDVAIAPRLIAFAQSRFGIPIEDPGSGHTAFIAGVRLGIR